MIDLGLDPALPAFELAGQDGRIDKTDAEFVDIIHSNSGMLWEVKLLFIQMDIEYTWIL